MKKEIEWFKYREKKPKDGSWCLVIKYNKKMDFLYYKKQSFDYDDFLHLVYLWSIPEHPNID